MKTDRNMFYPGMMNPMMPGMPSSSMGMPSTSMGMPSSSMGMPSTPSGTLNGQGFPTTVAYDIERRIDTLERQVRRLDTRVTRLETPYSTGQMPIGQMPAGQPYSTSVPGQDFTATNFPTAMHMM